MLIVVLLIVGLASYTTTTAFVDNDFLGGPDTVLSADAATTVLNGQLSTPLPDTTEVVGFTQGGFQDIFWQFKLRLPEADAPQALTALGAEGLVPFQTDYFGLPESGWWDPGAQTHQQVGSGSIPGFTSTQILTAPDRNAAGHTLIFVFAFQT